MNFIVYVKFQCLNLYVVSLPVDAAISPDFPESLKHPDIWEAAKDCSSASFQLATRRPYLKGALPLEHPSNFSELEQAFMQCFDVTGFQMQALKAVDHELRHS